MKKRIFSLILSLVVCISMIPAAGFTTYAASEVTVTTADELKAQLESSGTVTIKLGTNILKDVSKEVGNGKYWSTVSKGYKVIDMNGYSIGIVDNDYNHRNQTLINVNGGIVDVKNSKSSNGMIAYDAQRDTSKGYLMYRNVFKVTNGQLNLYGGSIVPGGNTDVSYQGYSALTFGNGVIVSDKGEFKMYGGSVFGNGYQIPDKKDFAACPSTETAAIKVEGTSTGLFIYDGIIKGKNAAHPVIGIDAKSTDASVHICGGKFYSEECPRLMVEGKIYSKVGAQPINFPVLPSEAKITESKSEVSMGSVTSSTYRAVAPVALQIYDTKFADATVGKTYPETLISAFGPGPIKYEISKGKLPMYLNLEAKNFNSHEQIYNLVANNLVRGESGTYNFTIKATDALGRTAQKDFSIHLNKSTVPDTYDTIDFTVDAGKAMKETYTWGDSESTLEFVSGSLPAGVKCTNEISTLTLSGTPTTAGQYSAVYKGELYNTGMKVITINITVKGSDQPVGPDDPYVFPFVDVPQSQWYYQWVKGAHQMGLIDGVDKTHYRPDDNMTYAQAIKLAACMNEKYRTGKITLGNGSVNWYDTYVDYCMKNGIIDQNYSSVINSKIDRQTYAKIFAKCLPKTALKSKNSIPAGSIPDVSASNPNYDAIYTLYKAGIINGSDSKGSFKPNDNIKRSEVAAILNRMMDPSVRVDAPVDLGK